MFQILKPSNQWMQGCGLTLVLLGTTSGGPAWARPPGIIEGTTVTVGGAPLNGMCGKLYDAPGNNELIDLAPTGTDGIPGHYIQENLTPGRYLLLFVNCGANTDGVSPDPHYTPILYGGTWTLGQSPRVVVTSNATTHLGNQQIPYGGYVTGTVTDRTINAPADTPPVALFHRTAVHFSSVSAGPLSAAIRMVPIAATPISSRACRWAPR